MKTSNFKILILLFLSAFSLSSCSSDASGDSNGTTTGDYFPMAVNNKWEYTNASTNTEVNIIGTANFGGNIYYELTDTDSQTLNQNWMTKTGASYYQKTGVSTEVQGSNTIVVQSYEIKLLRDDIAVGESWHGSAHPKVTYSGSSGAGSFNASVNYTGTITAKGVSETLGSVTYNDIIKIELVAVVNSNGQINTLNGEYWFAKDVGIIYDSATSTVDNITKTRYLTSYTLH